jgi:hypothetical protein
MKKPSFLFSLSLLMFLISSCDKSNPVSYDSSIGIIPLKVGNTWVMTFSYCNSNGVVTETGIDSAWVSDDTVISGQHYFLVSDQQKDSAGIPITQIISYLARNSPSGYSLRLDSTEQILYDYPYRIGDTSIVASNEVVTVPTGTYYCVVYQFRAGTYEINGVTHYIIGKHYICPNIGMIKTEALNPQNGYLLYRFVLTRVILN